MDSIIRSGAKLLTLLLTTVLLSTAAPASVATSTFAAEEAHYASSASVIGGNRKVRFVAPTQVNTGAMVGTKVTFLKLNGTLPSKLYRRVEVLFAGNVVATKNARKSNKLSLRFEAPYKTGSFPLRVRTVLRNGKKSTTAPVTVSVVTPPPAGDSTDWSTISGYSQDGAPVRWNPCEKIRWAFNPNGSEGKYSTGLADTTRAVEIVEGLTGLDFVYAGPTTIVPHRSPAPFPQDIDLYVAFSDPADGAMGGHFGMGGPLLYRSAPNNKTWIEQAAVVVASGADLPSGFPTDGPSIGQALVHELLHAVGLGHAKGSKQLMYANLSDNNTHPGAGDIAGAHAMGASAGCGA